MPSWWGKGRPRQRCVPLTQPAPRVPDANVRSRRGTAPGGDAGGTDRDNDAGFAGLVVAAQVRAAIRGADLAGECIVVIWRQLPSVRKPAR